MSGGGTLRVIGLHLVMIFGLGCGSPPESAPAQTESVAPTPAASPAVPVSQAANRSARRLKARDRARPPLPPWGIMNFVKYERCKVGETGTALLRGAREGRRRITVNELDRPPLAIKVGGEGRHRDSKAVPLAALFPEGATIRATTCTGSAVTIEPHEQWWLVKSTRGFVKGVRTDTRADLLRDVTLLELAPAEESDG